MSDRVHPVSATDDITDPSFGTRNVLGNAVFRWEYRPGSALFVVFTQQRDAEVADPAWHFGEATHELFRVPASSVLLVKWSYWWAPGSNTLVLRYLGLFSAWLSSRTAAAPRTPPR